MADVPKTAMSRAEKPGRPQEQAELSQQHVPAMKRLGTNTLWISLYTVPCAAEDAPPRLLQ
jgi:hypothetical protein